MRIITESAFQEALQQWKKSWKLCMTNRRDYFEGDPAQNVAKMSTHRFIPQVLFLFNTPH